MMKYPRNIWLGTGLFVGSFAIMFLNPVWVVEMLSVAMMFGAIYCFMKFFNKMALTGS